MSGQTIQLNDSIYEYLLDVSLRESPELRALREETASMPEANMQISPEQGQFMALLAQVMGAARAIEVGTFTGYSAACLATAMGPRGRLLACDVSKPFTDIARKYWEKLDIDDRIDLRLAPALETLDRLCEDTDQHDFWDLAFIDADKQNYEPYFERLLILVRPGGVILVDNVLWDGQVVDPDDKDTDTRAIRSFNRARLTDQRIDLSMVPIGDGLTIARKR